MGTIKQKSVFEHEQNANSDHSAHAQSIIRAFALHSYILKYPMILFADSEGPDQTARPRSLICAFAVRTWTEGTFSLGGIHI